MKFLLLLVMTVGVPAIAGGSAVLPKKSISPLNTTF